MADIRLDNNQHTSIASSKKDKKGLQDFCNASYLKTEGNIEKSKKDLRIQWLNFFIQSEKLREKVKVLNEQERRVRVTLRRILVGTLKDIDKKKSEEKLSAVEKKIVLPHLPLLEEVAQNPGSPKILENIETLIRINLHLKEPLNILKKIIEEKQEHVSLLDVLKFKEDVNLSMQNYLDDILNTLKSPDDTRREITVKFLYFISSEKKEFPAMNQDNISEAERRNSNLQPPLSREGINFADIDLIYTIYYTSQLVNEKDKKIFLDSLNFFINLQQKILEDEKLDNVSGKRKTPVLKKMTAAEYIQSRNDIKNIVSHLSQCLRTSTQPEKEEGEYLSPIMHLQNAFFRINSLKNVEESIIFQNSKSKGFWLKLWELFRSPQVVRFYREAIREFVVKNDKDDFKAPTKEDLLSLGVNLHSALKQEKFFNQSNFNKESSPERVSKKRDVVDGPSSGMNKI